MNRQSELEPAYVLHTRPYRETSVIAHLLTLQHGQLSLVAKGVRRPKSALRSLLQPFRPLAVSWYGKSGLKNLRVVEEAGRPFNLAGKAMLSALYINELLARLIHSHDACEHLFDDYQRLLSELAERNPTAIEPLLRQFEQALLEFLGYAIPFPEQLTLGGSSPDTDRMLYSYSDESGFSLISSELSCGDKQRLFSALSLRCIQADDYRCTSVLHDAKRLMRLAFRPLLGDRPLKSRELFLKHTANERESE